MRQNEFVASRECLSSAARSEPRAARVPQGDSHPDPSKHPQTLALELCQHREFHGWGKASQPELPGLFAPGDLCVPLLGFVPIVFNHFPLWWPQGTVLLQGTCRKVLRPHVGSAQGVQARE